MGISFSAFAVPALRKQARWWQTTIQSHHIASCNFTAGSSWLHMIRGLGLSCHHVECWLVGQKPFYHHLTSHCPLCILRGDPIPNPTPWLCSGAGYHLLVSPGWRCQQRGAVLPATPRPHLLCSRTMLSSPLLPASQTPLLRAFKPAAGLLGFLTTCFCSRKEVLEILTLAK